MAEDTILEKQNHLVKSGSAF